MLRWTPELRPGDGPLYLALAEALARDVAAGRLRNGTRLPTHRDLAERLSITVGTVTRGYEEARRRGLISGEVGRGTFVRAARLETATVDAGERPRVLPIDLSFNHPAGSFGAEAVSKELASLSSNPELPELLQYQPYLGKREHRAAGAEWLSLRGMETLEEEVVVTAGAQHAMLLALSGETEPGDRVLTEALTYQGMKSLSRMLRVRLEGLAMDEEGLLPDALEEACRKGRVKALYCTPTLQNPTGRVLSAGRRAELARILETHDVLLVEDDIYGHCLKDGPPPLSTYRPERSYYLTSLSKSLTPALRIGYLRAPAARLPLMAATMMTTSIMASPLMAEVATRLVRNGIAVALSEAQQRDAMERQRIARRWLKRAGPPPGALESPHFWLQLPEPWRAEEFVLAARERGVGVASAEIFAVGRGAPPHAVRVSLCAPAEIATLERGLAVLSGLLGALPPPASGGV